MDKFHEHLDKCEHCRNHPFNLCQLGAALLQLAGQMILGEFINENSTKD